MYLGDFVPGATVRHIWGSNSSTGASITRATNGTISVYKDGGTTQSTTGVTDTEDFDGLTGVHLVAIDTSADGTFYSAGSDFSVVLSAATIDGQTVNTPLFSFSLYNRTHLRPTVAGRTLDVSAGGEAGVDWANVGTPGSSVNLSATTVGTAASVTAVAAGGISNASFAANAISASKVDPDVGAEIADAVHDEPMAGHLGAGTAGEQLKTKIDAILDDTGTSGVAVADGALTAAKFGADCITAAKVAADVGTEIANAVWDLVLEGALKAKEIARLIFSTTVLKLQGAATTTVTTRDLADTKNRVQVTVDASGNREAPTLDAT